MERVERSGRDRNAGVLRSTPPDVTGWDLSLRMTVDIGFDLEFAPFAAFGLQECVGCGWAPGSGGVVGEVFDGIFLPGFEDWGHQGPGGFDSVAVGEEGPVAEHGVEQEAFVTVGGGLAEGIGVAEIHVDGADVHAGAGDLGSEAEADSLVRLDAHGEDVGLDAVATLVLLVLEEE